jgi:UDP-glucose 4-epimerase
VNVFVTGAAGFIGSHIVDALLRDGLDVVGWDNFSSGVEEFLAEASQSTRFHLVRGDILDLPALTRAMSGASAVCHFSANADVRFGTANPSRDLQQNTIGTHNVLEAMRANGVRRIIFASTGSVYGRAATFPTPEDAPFPVQTSLYGASKLAAEGLISAYAEGFDFQATVFRFVSILGPRYTHGHVIDFYKKLRADPARLEVLGNGKQRKSYLHVQDCVNAITTVVGKSEAPFEVFNLGTDEYCTVDESIQWICSELGVAPRLEYSGGEGGWVGDNPFIFLDCTRVRRLGWAPRHSIRDSVLSTLRWLRANRWILDRR